GNAWKKPTNQVWSLAGHPPWSISPLCNRSRRIETSSCVRVAGSSGKRPFAPRANHLRAYPNVVANQLPQRTIKAGHHGNSRRIQRFKGKVRYGVAPGMETTGENPAHGKRTYVENGRTPVENESRLGSEG